MLKLKYLTLGILLVPSALHAGQVYGSVAHSGQGVAKAAIEINCNGAVSSGTTTTDGSYRINVPQQGQCALSLPTYPGRPSALVFSYPDPSQYDFELVAGPGGTYQLRRR
jgi:hypothetical protein